MHASERASECIFRPSRISLDFSQVAIFCSCLYVLAVLTAIHNHITHWLLDVIVFLYFSEVEHSSIRLNLRTTHAFSFLQCLILAFKQSIWRRNFIRRIMSYLASLCFTVSPAMGTKLIFTLNQVNFATSYGMAWNWGNSARKQKLATWPSM